MASATGPSRRSASPSDRRRRGSRSGGSRLRVEDWPIRTKIVAVLVIPSVAFMLVAAVQVTDSVRRSLDLAQFAREARLAPQTSR